MAKGQLINSKNVKPLVCDETYSSKYLTGEDLAGAPCVNINEGTLVAGGRTAGGTHDETEIYYIVSGSGDVWLDDDCYNVVPGDFLIIPPGVFHWIDNTKSSEPFVLMTFWEKQEYNGVYFERKKAWGKSYKTIDED